MEKLEKIWPLLPLFLLAAFLRFWGISYGLPAVFNADEPHLVNLAVSYGSGGLNPHIFKYPTLWSYTLFFFYGIYYLAWSFLGLRHSVEEFGRLFVWNPTGFYLIARALAALFSAMALGLVYRMGKDFFQRNIALWAALLLAVSPFLVESAHAAKPESMMLLLSAAAWYFGFKVLEEGRRQDYILCGSFLGLALSSQYTAAPQWLILPLAHFLKNPQPRAWKSKHLWIGLGCAFLAFFAGTPFFVLDFHSFLANLQDLSRQTELASASAPIFRVALQVGGNLLGFAGAWSPAGILALLGALALWKQDRKKAQFLVFPIMVCAFLLSFQPKGGNARYLFSVFPALALLAALGIEELESKLRLPARAFLWITLLGPGAWQSLGFDHSLTLPDTRTLASRWIESHIPKGSSLLTDQIHASPRLSFSKSQVQRLYEKTLKAGHPRSRYYKLLLDSHPGGGYKIYQILRGYFSLNTQPGHVDWSRRGYDLLDAAEGLRAISVKVQYVVTTSHGATPENSPELEKFFRELEERARLISEFVPEKGKTVGPVIRIYRL